MGRILSVVVANVVVTKAPPGDGANDQNEDGDCDGIPNGLDCDSPCFQGDPSACGDDDGDGIWNQDDPDSPGCCPLGLSLAIDSNNDGEITKEDHAAAEDPGAMKVLIVNRGDADEDDIPDYADGFGMFGPDSSSGVPADRFAELKITLGGALNEPGTRLVLSYDDAALGDLYGEEVPVEDIQSSYTRYHRGPGLLRIWRSGADSGRTAADFIPSGAEMSTANLGCELTFYIEAVNGSPRATRIAAFLLPASGPGASHAVDVLPFDGRTGLSEPQVQGYTILPAGSVAGTPGNDIVFAPSGAAVIDAGPGDDIIVAPPGDQTIFAGSGNDVVFASLVGEKGIILGGIQAARPWSAKERGGGSDLRVEPLEDTPRIRKVVERAYSLLCGEQDPWYEYFIGARGTVIAVSSGGLPAGTLGQWCFRDRPGKEGKRVTIAFGHLNGSALTMAAQVREKILELAGRGSDDPCGLRVQFEGVLLDEINVGRINDQLHRDPQQPIQDYLELRQAAFKDAVELVKFAASVYIEGLRFASVGTDIVVAVAGLAEGDYAEAISLLPLVPSAVTGAAKLTFNVGAVERLNKIDDVIRHIPCTGGRSLCTGLPGWVFERGVQRRSVRGADGVETVIVGAGHLPASSVSGAAHAAHSEFLAEARALDGSAQYVVQNRTLRKATALNTLGAQGNKLPDLVVVRCDGKIDLYEIQSCGDDLEVLAQKLFDMMSAIPPELRGDRYPIPLSDYFNPMDCVQP